MNRWLFWHSRFLGIGFTRWRHHSIHLDCHDYICSYEIVDDFSFFDNVSISTTFVIFFFHFCFLFQYSFQWIFILKYWISRTKHKIKIIQTKSTESIESQTNWKSRFLCAGVSKERSKALIMITNQYYHCLLLFRFLFYGYLILSMRTVFASDIVFGALIIRMKNERQCFHIA